MNSKISISVSWVWQTRVAKPNRLSIKLPSDISLDFFNIKIYLHLLGQNTWVSLSTDCLTYNLGSPTRLVIELLFSPLHICLAEIQPLVQASISSSFSTKACDATPSSGVVPCLSLATPVFCVVHSGVSCHWVRDRGPNADTVIGYRAALSSPMRDDTNITILPPQIREVGCWAYPLSSL